MGHLAVRHCEEVEMNSEEGKTICSTGSFRFCDWDDISPNDESVDVSLKVPNAVIALSAGTKGYLNKFNIIPKVYFIMLFNWSCTVLVPVYSLCDNRGTEMSCTYAVSETTRALLAYVFRLSLGTYLLTIWANKMSCKTIIYRTHQSTHVIPYSIIFTNFFFYVTGNFYNVDYSLRYKNTLTIYYNDPV